MRSSRSNSPVSFRQSLLGQQLETVAQIISIQSRSESTARYSSASLADSIRTALNWGTQDPLLQQLSQAVGAFYNCLSNEIGQDKNTVTFTASEFGRTLQPNGNAGTDHAWGSHHLVVSTGSAQRRPALRRPDLSASSRPWY